MMIKGINKPLETMKILKKAQEIQSRIVKHLTELLHHRMLKVQVERLCSQSLKQ
jgi:hypothetical protein